jgi:two-component system nitrate/nitrite response regulator NarL
MRKILLIDDHRLFVEGMRYLLAMLGDDIRVQECYSAQNAIDLIDRGERFALALVDLSMPGMDGFSFLRSIRERRITCPVVVISSSMDPADIRAALLEGALGFIPKSSSKEEMLSGLRAALNGEVYLPDKLAKLVASVPGKPVNGGRSSAESSVEGINQRQYDVLELMADGKANKQIASVLGISEATVKYHIGILFRVLGVRNRTACINEAQQRKLI